ncbi:MAG: 16S rRNA processing protein RimM [Desulfobulbus sp.]|nr:16S rRNA processing protein RimM [Desulfobulbus sp.]
MCSSVECDGPLILLGTVVKPHGVRGEIKVFPHTEHPESIGRYQQLHLTCKDGSDTRVWTNIRTRSSGNLVVVQLKECTDRRQAEQLTGSQIWVSACDLPPAGPDEFYLYTLMGKQAATVTGQLLGTVCELIHSGQNILVLRDGDQEYLIPAVRKFIVSVDENRVVFDLPTGLIEMNR